MSCGTLVLQVTPDGKYVPPPPANAKASYATMLFVRADIVKNAGGCMAKAVTIATRYAAVRRQTAPKPGEREVQVSHHARAWFHIAVKYPSRKMVPSPVPYLIGRYR